MTSHQLLPTRVAEAAGVPDRPAVVDGLTTLGDTVDAHIRRLRSAGSYPIVLGLSVLVAAGVVGGVGLPALAVLPGAEGVAGGGLPAVGGVVLLLALLSALVLGRVRVPWLSEGWVRIERFAFIASLRILTQEGAELPAAVRASGEWGGGAARAAAEEFARGLEAGRVPNDLRPLLDPFESRMLGSAAVSGTLREALNALTDHHRIALGRVIPDAVVRIQVAAVLLAAVAVLVVGATFFGAYSRAILG
jgi:hypothetical protein